MATLPQTNRFTVTRLVYLVLSCYVARILHIQAINFYCTPMQLDRALPVVRSILNRSVELPVNAFGRMMSQTPA